MAPTITIEGWTGPWPDDDKDANFKHEVALYATADPLATITALGGALGIPVGGICHYVLAKWASAGAAAVLEIGPEMIETLHQACLDAEACATDAERLTAFRGVAQRISWLKAGLDA